MRFGTWNVSSLCRVGAIKSALQELEEYKLDLVVVQEVRWDQEGYQMVDNYTFFYRKENVNHH
jgi:exonuclease III